MTSPRKPNIVFILSDDLGWADLSVEGSALYESPNIDRIANEGMRFTQGYAACQVCSPSRASILTGKYPPRHGITDYIGAKFGEAWRDVNRFTKLLPPDYEHELRPDEITLAGSLRNAGYRTFFAGKWHLGDVGSYPEDHGFEFNKGGHKAGSPPGGYFSPFNNPKLEDHEPGESLPIRLGRETAAFLEDHKGEPFLAYLSFYSVHGPIQTSQDRWEKFRQKAVGLDEAGDNRFLFDRTLPVRQVQDCPIYAGMIEAMDDAVGIVLDKLDELGLAENTIVCFTSDNGGVSSGDAYSTSNLPLRGGKGRQWEGGIREPYYIRAPGVEAGSTCDVPVSGIDFFPTFLEMAGLPIPEGKIVDGMSILPLLMGEPGEEIAARDLFWHYPHYGNQGGEPSSIIRRGNWKLIHYFEDGHDELYDLSTDEGEQNDMAVNHAELVSELRQRLDLWLIEVGAKLPVHDSEYDAEKEKARLEELENKLMPKLEAQHAEYLVPGWEPNTDWWGSQLTVD
ncbi:MAG: sulfatase [Planctomycetota bacterium]|nr:sulfatase [Planctomycetota bacterium]